MNRRAGKARFGLTHALVALAAFMGMWQIATASAGSLRPDPAKAGFDKGRLFDDGCLVAVKNVKSKLCTYALGRDNLDRVFLFGDSHAMQYFPALARLGRRETWRLTGLTKAGCPPSATLVNNPKLEGPYPQCQEWRNYAVRRIARSRPELIVVSGASYYSAVKNGKKLSRNESRRTLTRNYSTTLRRLVRTGATVVVIKDLPTVPYGSSSDCVARNRRNPGRCAFPRRNSKTTDFGVKAARDVRGVTVASIDAALCPNRVCRAVIGNKVTYRGSNHLTATYSETLARFLGGQMPLPPR